QTALAFARLGDGPGEEFSAESQSVSRGLFVLGKIEAEFCGEVLAGDQMQMQSGAFKMTTNRGFIDVEAGVGDKKIAVVKVFYSVLFNKS
ncbi:MAG: hypothetical protein HQL23_07055, partial [Candidatus Omnitrophica bacterium]|nr:hypothetical protein [Candidatus Omnitrophota bacterium]